MVVIFFFGLNYIVWVPYILQIFPLPPNYVTLFHKNWFWCAFLL